MAVKGEPLARATSQKTLTFFSWFSPCKIKQNNLVINGTQDGRNS
jgi:hypothetical protein